MRHTIFRGAKTVISRVAFGGSLCSFYAYFTQNTVMHNAMPVGVSACVEHLLLLVYVLRMGRFGIVTA